MICCKLGKVLLVSAGVLGLGTLLTSQTKLGSYLAVYWQQAKDRAAEQISLDTQLARVRLEIGKLDQDIELAKGRLAKQLALVSKLESEWEQASETLAQLKERGRRATLDLEENLPTYTYDGREYSRQELERFLKRTLDEYRLGKAALDSRAKQLDANRRQAQLLREQLDQFVLQKATLETKLVQLETQLHELRLIDSQNKLDLNDSRLADIQQSLSAIETELAARKHKLDLDGQFAAPIIPVEARDKAGRSLSEQAREVFGVADSANK
jgi:chromosome segregation ATPase